MPRSQLTFSSLRLQYKWHARLNEKALIHVIDAFNSLTYNQVT